MEQVERLGFTLIEDLGQQATSKVWTRVGRLLSGLYARRWHPEEVSQAGFDYGRPLCGCHVPCTLQDAASLQHTRV